MSFRCVLIRSCLIGLLAAVTPVSRSLAQEIAAIDLTDGVARTGFRRPEPTSTSVRGFSGNEQMVHCRHPERTAGAWKASLVSLDRTDYALGDEPILEILVQNTGSTPIQIPVSPHIADLQAEDPAKKFDYLELHIAIWIAGQRWSTDTGGLIGLYGADAHPGTLIVLKPGQWLRVIGKGHLLLDDELIQRARGGDPVNRLYAAASLYKAQTMLTARESATVLKESCMSNSQGQSLPIHLTVPSPRN